MNQTIALGLVEKLILQRQTLATAESCTGGLCASLITNISGSSEIFPGGVITYSNQVKQQLLGVSELGLQKFGAVSAQVAAEMAQGVQKLLATDYALAITGIAGPTGGSSEKPVGTAFVGIASPGGKVQTWQLQLAGDRLSLKEQFATRALELLRQVMG